MQLINVWAACRDEHLPVVCVLWHFQEPGCLITDVISDPPVMVVINRIVLFSCLLLVFQPSVNRVEIESIKKERVEPKNTFSYTLVHKWQWLPSQAPQKLVCPLTLTSLHSSTSSYMQVWLSEIQNLKKLYITQPSASWSVDTGWKCGSLAVHYKGHWIKHLFKVKWDRFTVHFWNPTKFKLRIPKNIEWKKKSTFSNRNIISTNVSI